MNDRENSKATLAFSINHASFALLIPIERVLLHTSIYNTPLALSSPTHTHTSGNSIGPKAIHAHSKAKSRDLIWRCLSNHRLIGINYNLFFITRWPRPLMNNGGNNNGQGPFNLHTGPYRQHPTLHAVPYKIIMREERASESAREKKRCPP
jgi:hypothetical protein